MTNCIKCKSQVVHSLKFLSYCLFALIICTTPSACTDDEEDEFDLFMNNKEGVWETSDGTFRMKYDSNSLVVTDNGETSVGTLNTLGIISGNIKFGMLSLLSGDYTYSFKVDKMKSATKMEVTVKCYEWEEGNLLYEKNIILNKISEINE